MFKKIKALAYITEICTNEEKLDKVVRDFCKEKGYDYYSYATNEEQAEANEVFKDYLFSLAEKKFNVTLPR